ncbi:uncharacterized protein LOC100200031 isoform X1 [Hydra vulgaris]|uniref:uncharacterized protein LOC100200031 isoform X1 n=1 Tax=Hydra vulgaris TaxID=6087 RepID=UPI0002B49762|nr:uncharacterized protein LOC100200031 [Hydra vulgaris]
MRFYVRFLQLICFLALITWILIYYIKLQSDIFLETPFHKKNTSETFTYKKSTTKYETTNKVYRLAVVCYIPSSPNEVQTFLTMLYGSWRYISNKKNEFSKTRRLVNHVNLIVFTHVDNIVTLKTVCQKYNALLDKKDNDERCWYIRQDYEMDIGYDAVNSFIMFNRTDIYKILMPYKYTMRTDYDVFLTPALYTWKVKKDLVVGRGNYGVSFTRKRLKQISLKLNMTHKGVHNVGSTWVGESKLFINLATKVLKNTALIYLNEFNPNFPGLRNLKLKKNKNGVWPLWWRPVSLLYGAEISLNHWIDNFSVLNKDHLDTSSCSNFSIWNSPHVHCWHNNCEFYKFSFFEKLNAILGTSEYISSSNFHLLFDNLCDKDVSKMTISEYSTFIAWNSAGKYLSKMINFK